MEKGKVQQQHKFYQVITIVVKMDTTTHNSKMLLVRFTKGLIGWVKSEKK